MSKKLLLLDMDGTIREPIDGKWIDAPRNQKPILGAADGITRASVEGWEIMGVTNQGGVAAGHKSLKSAIDEQLVTLELFPEIFSIFFCPDFEGEVCWRVSRFGETSIRRSTIINPHLPGDLLYQSFRKPGSGMIMQAIDYFSGEEPPEKVWMVGDREEDALAAAAANVDFMWADVWRSLYLKGFQEVDTVSRHLSQEVLLKFLKDFQS